MSDLPEYEVSGIENIVRGVCIVDGRVLLCRPKAGDYAYLPGGHIEFGETSRAALVREMQEETGLAATVGDLLGVVESQFVQHGQPHCEISLVYRMTIAADATVTSRESWIEFIWQPLNKLHEIRILPEEMVKYVM